MKTYCNNNDVAIMDEETVESNWASREWRQCRDKEAYLETKNALDKGYDISKKRVGGENNNTLLITASLTGFTDTVRLLLSIPDINLDAKNNKGETALDVADNDEIKKMLLDAENGVFPTILRKGQQR